MQRGRLQGPQSAEPASNSGPCHAAPLCWAEVRPSVSRLRNNSAGELPLKPRFGPNSIPSGRHEPIFPTPLMDPQHDFPELPLPGVPKADVPITECAPMIPAPLLDALVGHCLRQQRGRVHSVLLEGCETRGRGVRGGEAARGVPAARREAAVCGAVIDRGRRTACICERSHAWRDIGPRGQRAGDESLARGAPAVCRETVGGRATGPSRRQTVAPSSSRRSQPI